MNLISKIFMIAFLSVSVLSLSNCSILKAASAPPKKNLDVLNEGTPRANVHASLGAPISTSGNQDSHQFVQGYATGTKATKVFLYTIYDLGTLFLAEIITYPLESATHDREVSLVTTYDEENKLESYEVIKGKSAVEGKLSNI